MYGTREEPDIIIFVVVIIKMFTRKAVLRPAVGVEIGVQQGELLLDS